ncbi:MAG: hypothetical protein ABSG10_14455 [Terracidiphilus sp.]|jgi:hypothetical protein
MHITSHVHPRRGRLSAYRGDVLTAVRPRQLRAGGYGDMKVMMVTTVAENGYILRVLNAIHPNRVNRP